MDPEMSWHLGLNSIVFCEPKYEHVHFLIKNAGVNEGTDCEQSMSGS